jgi:3-methylcrotonyl-CoA carboxylase beta subunit
VYPIHSKIQAKGSSNGTAKSPFYALLGEFEQALSGVLNRETDPAVKRHKEKAKLTARERIKLLIDTNTSFLELSALAAYNQKDNAFPSAGVVTGIGIIHGREAVIVANDATVKGGTYIKETVKKHLRAQEIAMENNLPCVYLVDSGGAFLPEQDSVFPDRDHFGRIFYNQARLSAMGIPQISIVMGSCTAGGAYIPAMSDETIIVRNQGTIFIGGPPLVKAATGEEVTAEELGGGEVHTSISGVADHLAESDAHALEICRNIFESLPKPQRQKLDIAQPEAPAYPEDELYSLIPVDLKRQTDVHEIIARLVDGSRFHEFKESYGTTLVTGFARIMGFPVGIIANNGFFTSESSLKGAHFIELCSHRKVPIVFLQNTTGFIVGKKYEHGGIARDGAKLINAVANASVPIFTVVIGASYGAGNYAMAGRAFNPRLLLMWPNAKIAVMGGEQASNVLVSIKEQQLKANGKELTPDERQRIKQEILSKYEVESSAYYSTSRIWDDGIIDPLDTRKYLALGISASLNRPFGEPNFGVFRM